MKRSLQGKYIVISTVGETVRAFVPNSLPPDPPLEISPVLQKKLDEAVHSLGRLDGMAGNLPDINLFLYMFVRKEAVLSSKIEGTQSSLSDLLLFEANEHPGVPLNDVREVSNYVEALDYGLERMQNGFPLSLRLLREIHGKLLVQGRGSAKTPGEFRHSQNWIGGNSLADAKFIPPHHQYVDELMGDLEKFLNNDEINVPSLLKIAIAHYQFETIHPFLDGNGRIGRLLITLYLVKEQILDAPLLYLSAYFERKKDLYYDNLNSIRSKNDIVQWIKYFLVGIEQTAKEAVATLSAILKLKIDTEDEIRRKYGKRSTNAIILLHSMFKNPFITVEQASGICNVTYKAANDLVKLMQNDGIIRELTGQSRNRMFVFEAYLSLFN